MSTDDIKGSGDRAVAAALERAKQTAGRNIPVFDDLPIADTANLRLGADLHDALLALLPLVGVWRGEGEGRGPHGDYRFGQQIIVSHDGADYLNWEARSCRLDEAGEYHSPGLRETGFWRFVHDPADPDESKAIELLLAHSAGYVELFYGRPRNQLSWELATDALARSKKRRLMRISSNSSEGVESQMIPPPMPHSAWLCVTVRVRIPTLNRASPPGMTKPNAPQ